MEYGEVLNKLTRWAQNMGYRVTFARNVNDEINFETKEITISTKSKEENQVYSLLHELGHLQLSKSAYSYERKFPIAHRALEQPSLNRSKRFFMDEIYEEIEAWKEGEKLAHLMMPKFDLEKYNKYAADCVFCYMKAAVRSTQKKNAPVK